MNRLNADAYTGRGSGLTFCVRYLQSLPTDTTPDLMAVSQWARVPNTYSERPQFNRQAPSIPMHSADLAQLIDGSLRQEYVGSINALFPQMSGCP